MTAYRELEARFGRLSALGEAAGVLHWDRAVNMPEGGAGARAEQLAALKLTCHEMLTDRRMEELLEEAALAVADDPWRAANVREMRRSWVHASAVEGELVEALSRAGMACEMKWREARPANDFAAVAPALKQVLALLRQVADAKAAVLGCPPYEALIDTYEPGARTERIDILINF